MPEVMASTPVGASIFATAVALGGVLTIFLGGMMSLLSLSVSSSSVSSLSVALLLLSAVAASAAGGGGRQGGWRLLLLSHESGTTMKKFSGSGVTEHDRE